MADIFDLVDLPSWLQIPQVDAGTAARVRRHANGWLMSATGLTVWPDPITDDLWAWAIELAAIAHRWPDGTMSEGVDDSQAQLDRQRRREILEAARLTYRGSGVATAPSWSFPEKDWSWKATTQTLTD